MYFKHFWKMIIDLMLVKKLDLSQGLYIRATIEMAKHLWNQSYIDLHKGKWVNIFYYSWLFENGNYKEIVDHYSKIPDEERVNLEPLSLVILAALAKIETKEALDQMCIIREKSSYVNKIRSFMFSSWVAYKLKNYGLAYDLLTRANLKT